MKITVAAKPNAKENSVERTGLDSYKVLTTATPEKGKANEKIIELLSDYLRVPKTSIKIIRGQKGNSKLIEIAEI